METIGEIKTAFSTFQNDSVHIATVKRWDKDLDLFTLKPYDPGSGYYSYTTNAPRNLANKVISMLTEAKVIIRVPEELLDDRSKQDASNLERFLYGIINLNNERFIYNPDTAPLLNQMGWLSVVRGGFALRMYTKKEEDGETMPELVVWDLYNMAYGKGQHGLEWAINKRKSTSSEIESEYGLKIKGRDIEVWDYWDKKKNGVIVNGKWAKPLEDHGLDYCPIFIFRAGDMPPLGHSSNTEMGKFQGESVFAPNRDLYPVINKTLSDLLTTVRRGVKVPLGIWSAGAERDIEGDVWQVERGAKVRLDINDKVAPLIEPTMPTNYVDLLNMLTGEEQRGGLSYVAQGQLGFRLSGFAINQLQSSISTVVVPFAQCIERALKVMGIIMPRQYAKGGWKPVKVWGRTSKDEAFGIPKTQKITPSAVKTDLRAEIRLEPTFPKDDAQRYEMAVRATQGERPLLSTQTAQDALLEIADTQLENEKIAREWVNAQPTMRFYAGLEAALAAGRVDQAYNIIAEMRKFLMATATQGQAAGGAGMSSSTLPAETMMSTPPGAANATSGGEGEL